MNNNLPADSTNQNKVMVFSYTRSMLIEDGEQLDVTDAAQQVGIKIPMFMTAAVHGIYVQVPHGVRGQNEADRLWNLLKATQEAMLHARPGVDHIRFTFKIRNNNEASHSVNLLAVLGPVEPFDPRPCVTLMHPEQC